LIPFQKAFFLCFGIIIAVSGSSRAQNLPLPSTPAFKPDHGPEAELERDLNGIFNDPHFSNAIWGVTVQSMATGEYLFRMNDAKSLLPASNFKLFTAAEALSLLGTNFRYTTDLLTTGRILSDGTLRGDLVIRGVGDPTLGSSLFQTDSSQTTIFDAWADSLAGMGIRRVSGAIIGDDSYFTPDYYPAGWTVEDLPYYYAMQSSALVFNEDQVDVTVTPGVATGSAIDYELNPSTDYVAVDNFGSTKADSITQKRHPKQDSVIAFGTSSIVITREMGGNEITITGKIPLHGTATNQQLSVEDPTLYAATLLRETLEEHDIQVSGETRTSRQSTKPYPFLKARVLATYASTPLSDIVREMDKESDNLIAEQLFRTVAKEIGGEGSWSMGAQVMKRYLSSIGIDTSRIAIADGSGLSRMDLVSADDIVKLLHAMHEKRVIFNPFYASLPIMGVDGTLSSRLKGTAAEGNVHAKTGFLTGDRSISGFLTTRDGEMLAFSMIGNNFTIPVREASNLQDLALLRLVNFSRK
jgi:D-alanyl-D-alanine carboxypeptidase/D-alanyl-D-alanine-endopeptidase (penicillin-binding protein 4)